MFGIYLEQILDGDWNIFLVVGLQVFQRVVFRIFSLFCVLGLECLIFYRIQSFSNLVELRQFFDCGECYGVRNIDGKDSFYFFVLGKV